MKKAHLPKQMCLNTELVSRFLKARRDEVFAPRRVSSLNVHTSLVLQRLRACLTAYFVHYDQMSIVPRL